MAYTDQEMSGNRIVAIVIVVLIHLALGYALVSGLAYSAVKKAVERVTTVDVDEPEEEIPEEEEPPPPEEVPDTAPPPPVAPPPPIRVNTNPPPVRTVTTIPPPSPPARVIPPPAPPAPPAPPPAPPPPPPPRFTPKDATPRNSQGSWVTTNDYPRRALREGAEGVTRVSLSVSADGRVANCRVTGSSGNSELDTATCDNIKRRARFRPATNGQGNDVAGSFSMSVRWQMPD